MTEKVLQHWAQETFLSSVVGEGEELTSVWKEILLNKNFGRFVGWKGQRQKVHLHVRF
jgi:hypothetical protein